MVGSGRSSDHSKGGVVSAAVVIHDRLPVLDIEDGANGDQVRPTSFRLGWKAPRPSWSWIMDRPQPGTGRSAAPRAKLDRGREFQSLQRRLCASSQPTGVPELMGDFISYVNTDYPSLLAQAAVTHAQFETIDRFGDGNGPHRAGTDPHRAVPAGIGVRAHAADQPGSLCLVRVLHWRAYRLPARRPGGQSSTRHRPATVAGHVRSSNPKGM